MFRTRQHTYLTTEFFMLTLITILISHCCVLYYQDYRQNTKLLRLVILVRTFLSTMRTWPRIHPEVRGLSRQRRTAKHAQIHTLEQVVRMLNTIAFISFKFWHKANSYLVKSGKQGNPELFGPLLSFPGGGLKEIVIFKNHKGFLNAVGLSYTL